VSGGNDSGFIGSEANQHMDPVFTTQIFSSDFDDSHDPIG